MNTVPAESQPWPWDVEIRKSQGDELRKWFHWLMLVFAVCTARTPTWEVIRNLPFAPWRDALKTLDQSLPALFLAASAAISGRRSPADKWREAEQPGLEDAVYFRVVQALGGPRQFFAGSGKLWFDEDTLVLQCPRTPPGGLYLSLLIGSFGLICAASWWLLGTVLVWVGMLIAWLVAWPLFSLHNRLARERLASGYRLRTVVLHPADIDSVRSEGPEVTLDFHLDSKRPERVTFYVPTFARVDFFRRFDALFPNKLPEHYLEAVRACQEQHLSESRRAREGCPWWDESENKKPAWA